MSLILANDGSFDHARLAADAEDLAFKLNSELGIQAGDRALICLFNSYEHLVLIFALWKLKAAFHSVAPTSSDMLVGGIADKGYRLVCIDVEQMKRIVPSLQQSFVTESPISLSFSRNVEIKIIPQKSCRPSKSQPTFSKASWQESLKEQPEAVFFTSGSTGNSKGVVLEWSRILQKGRDVLDFYRATDSDCIFPCLPVSHVYGLYISLGVLDRRANLVMLKESAQPATVIGAMKKNQVSILVCPPLVARFYFTRGEIDPQIMQNLKVISMGGAASPIEMVATLRQKLPNTRVIVSYGLVETYSTICCHEVTEAPKVLGLVGPIRFGAKGRIIDPETSKPLPAGEVGELCISEGKLNRYYDTQSESDYFTPEGFYRTGDLASMDADGRVFLKGRIKEIINAGGLSIRPEEIEEVILKAPNVKDCGVFAHTESGLEVVYAGVVLDCAPEESAEALRVIQAQCKEHLSSKMVPRKIIAVSKIPRGGLGKIQRRHLQDMVLFGEKK